MTDLRAGHSSTGRIQSGKTGEALLVTPRNAGLSESLAKNF